MSVPGLPRGTQAPPRRSVTETYAALRLYVDNWRWRDVPFYLRTGKRMAEGAPWWQSVPSSRPKHFSQRPSNGHPELADRHRARELAVPGDLGQGTGPEMKTRQISLDAPSAVNTMPAPMRMRAAVLT